MMSRVMKGVTPAMRQYLDIKGENPDAILFFRMGDFYEMFFDDAVLASKVLGIALTSRDKDKAISMCGVPHHAAPGYIKRLVSDGYKVAMCEQVEEAGAGKGIVKRAVSRVITPGTVIDDGLLEPKSNNFIAAVAAGSKSFGLAYMDVSTGEFNLTELESREAVDEALRMVRPLELIVEEGTPAGTGAFRAVKKLTSISGYDFELKTARARLLDHFSTASLDGFGCGSFSSGIRAAGALLHYIKDMQRSELAHVKRLRPYHSHDFLVMDSSTLRNLEVVEDQSGSPKGSLFGLLDHTGTAMGARRLKSWLLHPLKEMSGINLRLDAVAELSSDTELSGELRERMESVYDLERLISRVVLAMANPRDLVSLKRSLGEIPAVAALMAPLNSELLGGLRESLDAVEEASGAIEAAIIDTPAISTTDGGIISAGYSAPLDELRIIATGGKDWIASLEAEERKRTAINSLKIGYNKVFGYYIEVTKSNSSAVPADYIRKQTLVNAERYITPELKLWEEKVVTAEEKARSLEAALFKELLARVALLSERIQATADTLATIDALLSFATASALGGYVAPQMTTDGSTRIKGGRHPVVEKIARETFVPNDLTLDAKAQLLILTGPNMAGKSTYLRQSALIVLMAQVGCFVPAAQATVSIFDRIFSRIGASDDLSRGQSTFMVEMNETANILNNATEKSLIILDEIGRGTSTFDGLAIAWAVVEFLHDEAGSRAKTLFATHYHELTELSLTKERVKNYNMAVKEFDGRIIFLRKVVSGGASSSYGIHVARLAGLPGPVLDRAVEVLGNLESGELNESGLPRIALRGEPLSASTTPVAEAAEPLRAALASLDINSMTPVEALIELSKLKEGLEDNR